MFVLPELPYPYESLAPTLSEATLRVHHDKHHAKYVETTNSIFKESEPGATLESVIRSAQRSGADKLFNNAAQAWNHGFFWECMRPSPQSGSRCEPAGRLAQAIDRQFGSLIGLKMLFVQEAAAHFGSGWAWIVARGGNLSVVATHDAATPIADESAIPLMTCDLWEHAYYLDHRNDRAGYLDAWWKRLANWRLAETQYAAAQGEGTAWRYPDPK